MLSISDLNLFLNSGAIFSLRPGWLILAWGAKKWQMTPSPNSTSFYCPDFFLDQKTPWLIYTYQAEIEVSTLLTDLTSFTCQKQEIKWKEANQAAFMTTVQELKILLTSGDLLKAVPYVKETAIIAKNSTYLISLLKSALTSFMKAPFFTHYLYGFWDDQQGILGVTPEYLFTLEKGEASWHLKSMALAGTAKSAHELYTIKNLREHALVVEHIQTALTSFGEVNQGTIQTLQLTHLAHLMTPFHLITQQASDFEQLVKALHPTPALGAYPLENGLSWLLAYQQTMPRQRYGAPIGFVSQNQAHCYVAIRNVQWTNRVSTSQLQLHAGCGIVAASEAEEEWQEIQLKLQAIKQLLNL